MKSLNKLFVSFSKFVINFVLIYIITCVIELIAQSANYYIPFEFTFLIIFILYLIINKIFKLKSFGGFLFERFNKYKNYIAFAFTFLVLILIGNEIIKAKKVIDVVSYYSDYSHSAQDYTNRDSSNLVEISSIDSTKEKVFAAWLKANGKTPLKYILEKVSEHQVVLLGEMHDISNNLVFLNKIITDLYNAGVRIVAMEVCQSADDELLEKLVNGEKYDEDLALDIAQHMPWLMWGSKDYWDVLELVWKLNKSLKPNQEKMKIVGIDSDYDIPSVVMVLTGEDAKLSPFYEKFRLFRALRTIPSFLYRDELMAKQIEEKIINKNKKGIVLVGAEHSFLNFKQDQTGNGRMGYILHKKFGDKVFQVLFHGVNYSTKISKFFEVLTQNCNYTQLGFDVVTSPFEKLRDSSNNYFKDRPLVDFGDLAFGYLFFCPVDSLKHCMFIPNFVTQETFIKEKPFFEAVVGKQLQNAKELNEYYVKKFNQ